MGWRDDPLFPLLPQSTSSKGSADSSRAVRILALYLPDSGPAAALTIFTRRTLRPTCCNPATKTISESRALYRYSMMDEISWFGVAGDSPMNVDDQGKWELGVREKWTCHPISRGRGRSYMDDVHVLVLYHLLISQVPTSTTTTTTSSVSCLPRLPTQSQPAPNRRHPPRRMSPPTSLHCIRTIFAPSAPPLPSPLASPPLRGSRAGRPCRQLFPHTRRLQGAGVIRPLTTYLRGVSMRSMRSISTLSRSPRTRRSPKHKRTCWVVVGSAVWAEGITARRRVCRSIRGSFSPKNSRRATSSKTPPAATTTA